MHDVEISKAAIEDARALAEVHVRSWRWAYRGLLPQGVLDDLDVEAREQMWRDAIADARRRVWAARENGDVVGLCAAGPARDDDHTGEVYAIYLDENAVGRGDGKRMLDVALADLRRRFNRVVLWVLESNERARAFYEKNGFIADGERIEIVDGIELKELRYTARCA